MDFDPKSIVIALVDDDPPILKLMARILESEGFIIHAFSNGEDGLDFILQNPASIDLLVTDIRMPGMSGNELAFHVSQAIPGIRILFVTAYSSYSHENNHPNAEMKGHVLLKPFGPAELVQNVKSILSPA